MLAAATAVTTTTRTTTITCTAVTAVAAATAAGDDDDDDDGDRDYGDSFGDQDDATFGQSWDDLVEGVADEGVLHGHGRAGLPDPLETDALLEEGRSDPAAPPADGGSADGSGGVGGEDFMASDGPFERTGEEQEGVCGTR